MLFDLECNNILVIFIYNRSVVCYDDNLQFSNKSVRVGKVVGLVWEIRV